MKKSILSVIAVMLMISVNAQTFQFGLKGGVNYNNSGDLKEYKEVTNAATDIVHGAKNKVGYHGGIWLKFQPNNLFIRTEAVYTQYETEYDNNSMLTVEKIDIPLHIGAKIIGPLYIFAGPDFMYILDNDFSLEDYKNIKYDEFTFGLNVGVGVTLGKLSAELKWDKAFTGDEAIISDNNILTNNFQTDNRPNQLVFSLLLGF